jgi:hypothetical protein
MIPYPGPSLEPEVQDVVLYLRPETNGVRTESCMLKVLHDDPASRPLYKLVYLANLPGEFIAANRIVEKRYALRERFARAGAAALTPTMIELLRAHFGETFDPAAVVGAYEALDRLGMSERELFEVWVDSGDFVRVHQQSVKLVRGLYVLNYDIPALLHRDSQATDVFTMILRCLAPYRGIRALIERMSAALADAGILSERRPQSRVFHYSTGPFMQILDGTCYVLDGSGKPVDAQALSFHASLAAAGVGPAEIRTAIDEPIMRFRTADGVVVERHLFDHTVDCSYTEARERLAARVT